MHIANFSVRTFLPDPKLTGDGDVAKAKVVLGDGFFIFVLPVFLEGVGGQEGVFQLGHGDCGICCRSFVTAHFTNFIPVYRFLIRRDVLLRPHLSQIFSDDVNPRHTVRGDFFKACDCVGPSVTFCFCPVPLISCKFHLLLINAVTLSWLRIGIAVEGDMSFKVL